MWLLLACAHIPTLGSPAGTGLEVYGDPGVAVQGDAQASWTPWGFATFNGAAIRTYTRDGRPHTTWPTPCPPNLVEGVALPAPLDAMEGSAAFPRLVLECRPLGGKSAVYLVDPGSGESVPVNVAGLEAVGSTALFVASGLAKWVDGVGATVAERPLPFPMGSWTTAGTVWAAHGYAQERAVVWWTDLADASVHTVESRGRISALATDGARVAVASEAGVDWFDAGTGAPLGTSPVRVWRMAFVRGVLWCVGYRGGWIRLAGPDSPAERAPESLPPLDIRGGPNGMLGVYRASVVAWRPDGSTMAPLPTPWWEVSAAGVSADGRTVAVLDSRGTLVHVDRATGATREWAPGVLPERWWGDGPVSPSPNGAWIAVGSRPVFLEVATGRVLEPEPLPVGISDGAWTADACYVGLWPDGSNSGAFGWCLRDGLARGFGAPVYVPGSMGIMPFAVSRSEARVAVAERGGRLAEFASGRDGAPKRIDPIRTVPAWSVDGAFWRVRSIAYDATGVLVSLVCSTAHCLRRVGTDVATDVLFPEDSQLSADASLVVSWDGGRATLRTPAGKIVAEAPLAGVVRSVAVGNRMAVFVIDDGRLQVLDVP